MKITRDIIKDMIKEALNESTFGSIKRRIDSTDMDSARTAKEFVVMSSDRSEREKPDYSGPSNKEAYEEFRSLLNKMGLQNVPFVGSWEETDKETGEKVRVMEQSVIIYKDPRPDMDQTETGLFQVGMDMSEKYDQEAFIYGRLEKNPKTGEMERKIRAYGQDGSEQNWGGPWSSMEAVKDDAPFWSRVRSGGPAFQFVEEDVEIHEAPSSMMEAMKISYQARSRGNKVKFVRGK